MNTKNTSIGIIIITTFVVGFAVLVPLQSAEAAASTSFRLYTGSPNDADGGAKDSTNFKVNEDRMTWRAFPLASTSFQMVTAPPTGGSSGGGSSSGGGGGSSGSSSGGGGGRRGVPNIDPPVVDPEPTPEQPDRPAAPEEPEPEKPVPPIFTGDIDIELLVPIPSVFDSVSYPRGERLIDKMHYFYLVDDKKSAAPECPVGIPYYTQLRNLLLLILFCIVLSMFFCFLVGTHRDFANKTSHSKRSKRS